MKKTRDNYSPSERKDYNRYYYPNNKERMQEQRKTPLAIYRRKLNRLKRSYEAQITALLGKMATEITLIHNELQLNLKSKSPLDTEKTTAKQDGDHLNQLSL